MDKLRFPTACPHSALSRPQPHRFCNNDSSERQRLQPAPGLLRHPRKSGYGTLRPIAVGIPRPIARNNTHACVTHDEALDRAVRTGQIHDLRARSKRGGREKTEGTAARLRTRSRVGALARPLRRARNRSPGSDDPRLRRWSYGDQPRHGPDCDPSPRCRDEPPVGSTHIHVCRESTQRLGQAHRCRREGVSASVGARGGWGRSRTSGGPGLWPGVDGAPSRRGGQAVAVEARSRSIRP